MEFPKFIKVRQAFNRECISNAGDEVTKALADIRFEQHFKAGEKIAIAVGSRGIANLPDMVKVVVDSLKAVGTLPFIVPAMGSHGGATAAGQIDVLESLGITESSMGVKIISSMEVVELGKTENGATVYIDKNAWEADGIVLINRMKPHTRFKADNESGLMKMVAVGLGKEKGCTQMHAFGLHPSIIQAARLFLGKVNVRLGIGIVENSYDQTVVIKAAVKADLELLDCELLRLAKSLMPKFPLEQIDILVIGEMGKNISGTGMDVNVLGRVSQSVTNDNDSPRIERIVPLNLTEASHGNALGIGLGDVVPRHLVNQIDWKVTYKNVIAAAVLDRAKLPLIAENDREALQIAIRSMGFNPEDVKIVFVRNTLSLDSLIVSKKVYHEISGLPVISIDRDDVELEFDAEGNIPDSWWQHS